MFADILTKLSITRLNDMQTALLEATQSHKEIVLISPTGTGKTLAFLLAILQELHTENTGIQAMIIVPSRELALQIEQVFKQMATGFKVNCCYGGHNTQTEIQNLSHPPALIVGTPGRLAYHIRNRHIHTKSIKQWVIDEFDKALELGFHDDIAFILHQLPAARKRLLTSATPLPSLPTFTDIQHPFTLDFSANQPAISAKLSLKVVQCGQNDKLATLFALICAVGHESTLVFCNQREFVDKISAFLTQKNIAHGCFHGKMEQMERERALIKFRNGTHRLLVTSDLASRGLDIPEIAHIIHFQLPPTIEVFTHRNGRTARMHASGSAYILLGEKEYLPTFIEEAPTSFVLPSTPTSLPSADWCTIYIAAGKKDKINKIDIVGLFLQKGKLPKEALGRIEVLDNAAYAAVKTEAASALLALLKEEKIKNKKVKIALSV